MPIYNNHHSYWRPNPSKRTGIKKYEDTDKDLSRFVHMPYDERKDYWEFRLDVKKYLLDKSFIINQQVFVNRPDLISYQIYGAPQHWWILALANDIDDPFTEFHLGRVLVIPDINLIKKTLGL